MLSSILTRIKQFFAIGFVAWVFQKIPFGFLLGYAGIALVQYDTNMCDGADSIVCANLRYLYKVGDFDHAYERERYLWDINSVVANSPSCDAEVNGIFNEYTSAMLDWYIDEIDKTPWYDKLNSKQRSRLRSRIKHKLKDGFDIAVQSELHNLPKSSTVCEVFGSDVKGHLDKIVLNLRDIEVTDELRQAVWYALMPDEEEDQSLERRVDAVQVEDTTVDEALPPSAVEASDEDDMLRLLPLVEAKMQVNVRSDAGIDHPFIDWLDKGQRVCQVEDTVVDGKYTWVRVRGLTGSDVEVDGWVYDGLINNQPTLSMVDQQSTDCVETGDAGDASSVG